MNDLKTLKDYLSNSIVSPEAKQELIAYLNEAFNRIISTFELIPDKKNGKLLEIGANPYFLTILIKKYKKYNCFLINYFGENCSISSQTIENIKYGENHIFNFQNINIEKVPLPFPEKYFDVVIYGEVIEHLTENPIFSLYNIHKVLRDDGILIISTPNVFRYQNIKKFLIDKKNSIYDPYSIYGIYGRHNREYSMYEIQDILEKTGFSIINKKTLYAKDKKGLKKIFSILIEKLEVGDYLLVKTRKKSDFNWYFPEYLYRGTPNKVITDDYMTIGKNCNVHVDDGWNDVEKWNEICHIRWTKKSSKCYLKPKKTNNSLIINYYSAFNDFEFKVIIIQNTRIIAEFDSFANSGWRKISYELPEISYDPLLIEFQIKESWIPQQMGINADERELGIAIQEVRLV
ncbi:MAG: class I SAM-dependent methyltransferase [Nitrososphaeraceae archaeon]|nr:class I SAM-dependent methyltransferase [Nitrososphaeraceae archaeon]